MHFRLDRIEARNLPIPAGKRQLEQRLANRLREFFGTLLGRGHIRDQGTQIDVEAAVERALDGVTIERRQHHAGDYENGYRQAGRPEEKAKGERVSAHRAASEDTQGHAPFGSRQRRAFYECGRQRLRWYWNRGRSPAGKGAQRVRCAKPRGRYDASNKKAADTR